MSDDPEKTERMRAFMEAQEGPKEHQQERWVQADQYAFDSAQFPTIPTSNELSDLIAGRDAPKPAPAPSPDPASSDLAARIREDDARQREERIDYLNDRLGEEQERFERSFDEAIQIEP